MAGKNYVGSLVGYCRSISYNFTGCNINSTVIGNNYVGGIIGYIDCSFRNGCIYK